MKTYLIVSYESGDYDHIGEIITVTAESKDHAWEQALELCPFACGFQIQEYEEDSN